MTAGAGLVHDSYLQASGQIVDAKCHRLELRFGRNSVSSRSKDQSQGNGRYIFLGRQHNPLIIPYKGADSVRNLNEHKRICFWRQLGAFFVTCKWLLCLH